MKPLVVYYSRTGTTRKVAEDISSILKCPVDEIIDETGRRGFIGFILAILDAFRQSLTNISGILHDPAEHDIIFIGTPVWASSMPPAIRTYLTKYKGSIRKLAVFCTFGASGQAKAVSMIEGLAGLNASSVLCIPMREVSKKEHFKKISDFVEDALKYA